MTAVQTKENNYTHTNKTTSSNSHNI